MYKKILILITILACTIIQTLAQSKTFKSIDEAKQMSLKISNLFYKDSIQSAIKEMKPYWPIPEDEIDDMQDKTIKYLNMLDERFGYKIEAIKISEERINNFALKEIYFIRYEKSAIKLTFKYYDTGHGWIINGFKWDDEYSSEFK